MSPSIRVDIDECSAGLDACDHICINTVGSYQCACVQGYTLLEDERNCAGTNTCTAFSSPPLPVVGVVYTPVPQGVGCMRVKVANFQSICIHVMHVSKA